MNGGGSFQYDSSLLSYIKYHHQESLAFLSPLAMFYSREKRAKFEHTWQLYSTFDPFSNIDISTGFAISHVAISIFLGCLLFFATSLTGLSILKFGIGGNSIFIPYLIHK